jgi:tRNA threonylcarbamoyladenosine biosynthesis protein TsaE
MMKKKKITQQEMSDVAKDIIQQLPTHPIVTLSGPLGAGKTTLVQEILKELGVSGPIISPTYNYVTMYKLEDGKTVYHFDLYRLNSEDEFIAAGFDEYLYQPESFSFIEWPQVINEILEERFIAVKLEHDADDTRLVSVILK